MEDGIYYGQHYDHHHYHPSQPLHHERRQPLVGRLGSGLSGGGAAAGGCHRRAGGNLLCGSLVRGRARALESLFGFL